MRTKRGARYIRRNSIEAKRKSSNKNRDLPSRSCRVHPPFGSAVKRAIVIPSSAVVAKLSQGRTTRAKRETGRFCRLMRHKVKPGAIFLSNSPARRPLSARNWLRWVSVLLSDPQLPRGTLPSFRSLVLGPLFFFFRLFGCGRRWK